MTIIIIIVIFFILAQGSSRGSKIKNPSQLNTVSSLREVAIKYNEHLEKQEAEKVENLEKMELKNVVNAPEPEPTLTTIKHKAIYLDDLEDVESNIFEETPAQAVIREFKKRNITSLWHMTHKDNVASILKNGFKSHSEIFKQGGAVDISNQSVQALRHKPDTIYNRPLHDYVPTYLNIKNPMLFFKRDCNEDICLLEISIDCLADGEFVFTDGNAAAFVTRFFNTSNNLEALPWDVLNNEYWADFEDGKRKRCAEVLVYPTIKLDYIKRIHCYSASTFLNVANPDFKFEIGSDMYF